MGSIPTHFKKMNVAQHGWQKRHQRPLQKKAVTSRGVGGHFDIHLKDQGKKNHLQSFRGHRFNILFHAAGSVYHHRNDIREFLDLWGEQNDILRSVSFDIREPLYLDGIRSLGLLDKLVTGPLWRLIETAPNALSLNTHLHQLQVCLENGAKMPPLFLTSVCLVTMMPQ